MATCLPFFALSQRDFSAGLHLGVSDYYGDLNLKDIGSSKEFNPGFGLFINKNLSEAWALNAELLYLQLSGDDANFEERAARGFSFDNQLFEISLSAEWYVLASKKLSPYLTGGLALALGDPTPDFSEKLEDYPKTLEDINADYSNANFVLPVGIGLRYLIHDNWILKLKAAPRIAFTDYLDGISQAGNPEKNDWYSFTGISIGHRFASKDSDKDGVVDKNDNCPQVPGDKALAGCPDTDKDGVLDHLDNCPQEAGTINGCPDRDGDRIVDFLDNCPDEPGTVERQGCPEVVRIDTDGDGLVDEEDQCPQEAGPISRSGCPVKDRDGDGVEDDQDDCPDEAGLVRNNGCPIKEEPPVVVQKEEKTPDWFIQNLYYGTNISQEAEHDAILQKVIATMNAWPEYDLTITGHTDDAGDEAYNQALSKERAKNCYQYLLSNGIPASRMTYSGLGEGQPAVPNTSSENRSLNRRTVLELKLP